MGGLRMPNTVFLRFQPIWTRLAGVFVSLFCAAGGAMAAQEEVVIEGVPVVVTEESIKCDIDPADVPKDISVKRLVDCNSAELVEIDLPGESIAAIKFTISPDDKKISSGTRAELRDMHVAKNGDETWYRFSTLLPGDFPMESKHRLVMAQWHERVNEGQESLRPPLSHRLWDGRFVVTLWNGERIKKLGTKKGDGEILHSQPELQREVFHEYAYKVVWSPEDDGEIVGWRRQCQPIDLACTNGVWEEFIRYNGPTGYTDKEVNGYYFKIGLYTVREFDVPFTAYHNGYGRGASAADIGLTDPMFQ
jgi:hypothetical protein